MKKLFALFICLYSTTAFADIDTSETKCASQIFGNALIQNANAVNESTHESEIKSWIYQTFSNPDVLKQVLECPEIAGIPDNETIKFTPVQYNFPAGRTIVVNYETQPKILKQRLMISTKRDLTSGGDSPRIGESDDGTIWTNTDPAWYGIMVVEHDALKEFVGPDKNNTISLNYIKNNINNLYPSGNGGTCTDRSAKSRDITAINQAMLKTINITDDSNDYYVAGDVNLQWISYAEMALDVVITVATFGGGTIILGATKAARASKAIKGLTTSIKALSQTQDVVKYVDNVRKASKLADEIKALDKVADNAKIADKTAELDKLKDSIKTLENTNDVKKYRESLESYHKLNKYADTLRGMRALRNAQRGNVAARIARATKAAWTGGGQISKAARLGRSSKISQRALDWLSYSTMKNAGALAKIGAASGALYTAIKFAGDMYDWTETSTGEFTNGVEFSPLLLLSADDIAGQ
ncbi:MAG: hypothetical protein IIV74_02680, partial [Alphaproteobacteria bacterium]|nr:hypothetical protein [Alphaproteobacteria bacterium]